MDFMSFMHLEGNEFTLSGHPNIYLKGGGGGGSSGTVDFPIHMKDFHYQALSDNGVDTVNTSMADLLNVALTTNPYAGIVAYDASTEVADMLTALASAETAGGLITEADWANAVTTVKSKLDTEVFDSATIDAEVAAFTTLLDQDLDTNTYPAFEAGMRDINAVMNSAFVTGKALIVEGRNAQVAKYDADLRHKAYLLRNEYIMKMSEGLLNWYVKVFEVERSLAMLNVDVNKTKIIAMREGVEQDIKVTEAEGTWEFEAYMYAGNFLGSIGGGTYVPPAPKGMSTGASALSGALSGAAMGAATGNPMAALAGGVIGGIGGLLS